VNNDEPQPPKPPGKRPARAKPAARGKPAARKRAARPEPPASGPMSLDALLAARTKGDEGPVHPVVLTTRIRLARNLARTTFPGRAGGELRAEVLRKCREAVARAAPMQSRAELEIAALSPIDRMALVERHLVSRELAGASAGAGAVISRDRTLSVMINEEDHLRIQALAPGFQLTETWKKADALDTEIEATLDYAFSPRLGYLTACPTNLGTGMRASAMMHLPALVIAGHMDKVVRAVNQFGLVVRGLFGEGSDASGSIFQISNQTSLGESEEEILKRLGNVLETVIESETNARKKLMQDSLAEMDDKIGRAYGILKNSHLIGTTEALNLLSLVRLGIALGKFPAGAGAFIDGCIIEIQPGSLQRSFGDGELEAGVRDALRAEFLRRIFAQFPAPRPWK
jgi:protein arginine kinase